MVISKMQIVKEIVYCPFAHIKIPKRLELKYISVCDVLQRRKSKKVSVSAAPPTVVETSEEKAASIALRQSLQAGASEVHFV